MQITQNTTALERTTPESVGISSRSIIKLMDTFKERGIENHSFMILRHGKVCAEAWAYPYNADTPHALYSFSKSVSSTAFGFLVDEKTIVPSTGKPIDFNTLVGDVFPGRKTKKEHKYDKLLTYRNLLTMHSSKKMNLLADKGKIDWIEDYMNASYHSKPGTYWNYCNENSFMLCATVKELTGQTVIEYLTPRLFEPLGIEIPRWECNQENVEAGGWGLYLKTEDMAKFILTYLNGGKYNGEQIIPEWYVKEATKKQVNNDIEKNLDTKAGYGYQFWMNGGPAGGFRADGMFSQHGVALPKYDAVIICTSGCPMEQHNLDALWNVFPDAFSDEPLPEDPAAYDELTKRISEYSLNEELPEKPRRTEFEKQINGREYKIRKKLIANIAGFPSSIMAMPITFMDVRTPGNIDNLKFEFKENELQMSWTEKNGEYSESIPAGMDGKYRYGTLNNGPLPYTSAATACWNEDGSLDIKIRPVDAVSGRSLKIRFKNGDKIKIKMGEAPAVKTIADFLLESFSVMISSKLINKIAALAFNVVPPILDPTLHGKAK